MAAINDNQRLRRKEIRRCYPEETQPTLRRTIMRICGSFSDNALLTVR